MVPIYTIPQDANFLVVSDFFVEDIIGGAELTLEAILQKCPQKYFKIRSSQLTTELIEQGKDKYWILVNFSGCTKDRLVELATSGAKYSIIECDYKYCKFRSSHLHLLQTGETCTCEKQDAGRFIYGLFKRAQNVHFMSAGQMAEYTRLFPGMESWPQNKLRVQGSTFSDEGLQELEKLYQEYKDNKNGKWAILSGASWIKNEQYTIDYCRQNDMPYELIGGLSYNKFIKALAQYSGLVFHPAGFDTNPRITIEAKILGLKLDLNDNVQQRNEDWFTGTREECLKHHFGLAAQFWKNIKV